MQHGSRRIELPRRGQWSAWKVSTAVASFRWNPLALTIDVSLFLNNLIPTKYKNTPYYTIEVNILQSC